MTKEEQQYVKTLEQKLEIIESDNVGAILAELNIKLWQLKGLLASNNISTLNLSDKSDNSLERILKIFDVISSVVKTLRELKLEAGITNSDNTTKKTLVETLAR